MKFMSATSAALLIATAVATSANAHQIWIQPNAAGEFHVYYGEFGENLRETSPGLLDKIDAKARYLDGDREQSADTKKGQSSFALTPAPGNRDIVAENATPIMAEARVGERIYQVAYQSSARYVPDLKERLPKLTLDIVPSKEAGKFIAYFRNAPLKKAKVHIVAESGWMKETRTDDAGGFEAAFPWKTTYVLEVTHIERVGGEHAGKKFDASSFSSTLSHTTKEGLSALSPPQAGIPSKQ